MLSCVIFKGFCRDDLLRLTIIVAERISAGSVSDLPGKVFGYD